MKEHGSDRGVMDFNWQGHRDDSQFGHNVTFHASGHIELFIREGDDVHWYCLDPLFYESFRARYIAVLSQRAYVESSITDVLQEFAQKGRELSNIVQ